MFEAIRGFFSERMTDNNGYESPYADFPKETVLNNGKTVIVEGQYLDVDWDKKPALISAGILVLLVVATWTSKAHITVWLFMTLVIWSILSLPAFGVFFLFFHKKLNIKIDEEAIHFDGRRYLRSEQPEFGVEQHHKAWQEMEREVRSGRPRKPKYRDAVEVVMLYGEKRVVIAQMRAKNFRLAEVLAFRLTQLQLRIPTRQPLGWRSKESIPASSMVISVQSHGV
jgi:hypothetical protein